MNTHEAVTQVLSDRIASNEGNIKMLEARLVAAVQTIQQLRHEISIGIIERTKKNRKTAEQLVVGIRDEREIVVPDKLRISSPKRTKGKRKAGGGNRSKDIVNRRWALWKIQYEQGYTTSQIAKAWKCNRETIDYAKKRNWRSG